MLKRLSSLLLIAVTPMLLMGSGCGDSHGVVPVSGTVTIDGVPIQRGDIRLYPEGSRPATGLITDGKFSLTCFKLNDGAPVGTHPATVTAVEYVNDSTNKWYAPKKYADQKESGLTVTIDGPTQDLEVKLTWEGSKQKGPFADKF